MFPGGFFGLVLFYASQHKASRTMVQIRTEAMLVLTLDEISSVTSIARTEAAAQAMVDAARTAQSGKNSGSAENSSSDAALAPSSGRP